MNKLAQIHDQADTDYWNSVDDSLSLDKQSEGLANVHAEVTKSVALRFSKFVENIRAQANSNLPHLRAYYDVEYANKTDEDLWKKFKQIYYAN